MSSSLLTLVQRILARSWGGVFSPRSPSPVVSPSPLDLDSITQGGRLEPSRKLLLMVLLLCLKDRATQLIVVHQPATDGSLGELRMSYIVAGVSYELVPPPPSLLPHVFEDLRQFAPTLHLRMLANGLSWDALVTWDPHNPESFASVQSATLTFAPSDPTLPHHALLVLNETIRRRKLVSGT